jgi:hypothetical protein
MDSKGVPLLCLWLWRGVLAALWAGAEECGRFRQVRLFCACCLLPDYDF